MRMGEKIMGLRIAKNLNIKDLAIKCGMDPSLLSRIEAGKRNATKEQLREISFQLDIPFENLLKIWLENKVYEIVKEYPTMSRSVLSACETRVEYLTKNQKEEQSKITEEIMEELAKIDILKEKWNIKKPLDGIQLRKLKEYFANENTYESNKIEGNTLTMQETYLVVNKGITISGKSLTEHLEALNHNEAIDLIYDLVLNNTEFTEYRLKQIHQLVLQGIDTKNAGRYRTVPVRISGSKHLPPQPFMLNKMMEDYFIFYAKNKGTLHPVILAAEMHERLVSIHPFIDGNGRTSRLIMNLILLQNGYTIATLKGNINARMEYYKSLEGVQVNNNPELFYTLVIRECKHSLTEHLSLT